MRVMLLVQTTANSEAGEGQHPTSRGKRIRFDGADRTVIDGPFGAIGELVAGFWIWRVKDMVEAAAWVKHCPNPMTGPREIEIRQIFETEDFGEALTPQIAEQEKRLREKSAGR